MTKSGGLTQTERLLAFLKGNPGASSLEITLATRIVNVTGRVSDLRAAGHRIECVKDDDGVARYVVVHRTVTKGEQVALW
jgi:hypothetical protein